jgi:hypothetical protein
LCGIRDIIKIPCSMADICRSLNLLAGPLYSFTL